MSASTSPAPIIFPPARPNSPTVAELEELFIFRLDIALLFQSNVAPNEEVNAHIGVRLG